MNYELIQLIKAVKENKSKPVQAVVDEFFSNIGFSVLKHEYERLNKRQRAALIRKLETERK
jgi:hypothetical protein